jgi:hypothetical protein
MSESSPYPHTPPLHASAHGAADPTIAYTVRARQPRDADHAEYMIVMVITSRSANDGTTACRRGPLIPCTHARAPCAQLIRVVDWCRIGRRDVSGARRRERIGYDTSRKEAPPPRPRQPCHALSRARPAHGPVFSGSKPCRGDVRPKRHAQRRLQRRQSGRRVLRRWHPRRRPSGRGPTHRCDVKSRARRDIALLRDPAT